MTGKWLLLLNLIKKNIKDLCIIKYCEFYKYIIDIISLNSIIRKSNKYLV